MRYKNLAIATLLFCIPVGIVFGANQRSDNRPFLDRSKAANHYLDKAQAIIADGSYAPIYENKNGEKEEFINLVNKSLKIEETAKAYLYLGIVGHMAFDESGYKEAVDNYGKAIELNPEYMRAYIALAATHLNNKNYKGCIHRSEQALKVDPQNQTVKEQHKRCTYFLNQRNFHECTSDADKKKLLINSKNKVVLEKINECMAQLERK